MMIKFIQSISIFIFYFIGVSNLCSQDIYDYYYMNINPSVFFSDSTLEKRIDIFDIDLNYLNAVIFHLTNNERSKFDLPIFLFYENLYKSSIFHSESMIKYNYFDHINNIEKKMKTPYDRIFYFNDSYTAFAENILENNLLEYEGEVLNYRTEFNSDGTLSYYNIKGDKIHYGTYIFIAQRLITQWMNSPGHRANILNKKLSHLGCACAIDISKVPVLIRCTQNFGTLK